MLTHNHTHVTIRSCARCGRDLTDPASRERGIGPVCRQLDNAVLARQIPADLNAAMDAYGDIRHRMEGMHPDLTSSIDKVDAALIDGVKSGDYREAVMAIERILSYDCGYLVREGLYGVTEALGYTSLVLLWKGDVVKGASELSFTNGRLVLKSPRPPKSVLASIRAIKGRRFEYTAKTWSFPASQHEAVQKVCSFFVKMTGVKDAIKAAKEAPKEAPEAKKTALPAVINVTSRGSRALEVTTPYNAAFVNELKSSIPWQQRKWDPKARVWRVHKLHLGAVEELVKKHYGNCSVTQGEYAHINGATRKIY